MKMSIIKHFQISLQVDRLSHQLRPTNVLHILSWTNRFLPIKTPQENIKISKPNSCNRSQYCSQNDKPDMKCPEDNNSNKRKRHSECEDKCSYQAFQDCKPCLNCQSSPSSKYDAYNTSTDYKYSTISSNNNENNISNPAYNYIKLNNESPYDKPKPSAPPLEATLTLKNSYCKLGQPLNSSGECYCEACQDPTSCIRPLQEQCLNFIDLQAPQVNIMSSL